MTDIKKECLWPNKLSLVPGHYNWHSWKCRQQPTEAAMACCLLHGATDTPTKWLLWPAIVVDDIVLLLLDVLTFFSSAAEADGILWVVKMARSLCRFVNATASTLPMWPLCTCVWRSHFRLRQTGVWHYLALDIGCIIEQVLWNMFYLCKGKYNVLIVTVSSGVVYRSKWGGREGRESSMMYVQWAGWVASTKNSSALPPQPDDHHHTSPWRQHCSKIAPVLSPT